jgi:hypothetical protein
MTVMDLQTGRKLKLYLGNAGIYFGKPVEAQELWRSGAI